MSFTTLGLSDQILRGVAAAGHTKPTPIQSLAILPALAGRDIIGCAQTGTGKTAAFVLPILEALSKSTSTRQQKPRALVLTPTRELAQQVYEAATSYGKFTDLRAVALYGGVNITTQSKRLQHGIDIAIATPGRLLDLMERRAVDLSGIEVLVLDEADRMLDMGFIRDVRRIIAATPAKRQTMLFSATVTDEIHSLAARILRNPQKVAVGEQHSPVGTITQHMYSARTSTKLSLLLHVLEAERMESVLVFSRTKHGADKISRWLERSGVASMAIHSNRTQSQRQNALDGFREKRCRVLVATDIAARGIDVEGISHVINFDIPRDAKDYVHRIGRTGRAGATGEAITFVGEEDQQHLRSIERFISRKITPKSYPGFTPPAYDAAKPQLQQSNHHGHREQEQRARSRQHSGRR